jgi:acyl dehydratase
MPIDPTAVGANTGPFASSWTEDDCMRYALSIGAAVDDPLGAELAFVTENTAGHPLVALPTMCMVLGGVLSAPSPMRKIGSYDPKMSVHGSVEFTLHRPLPTRASVQSTITIGSITDKRSGALVEMSIDASEPDGTPLFQVRNGIFIRGEGGFGGPAGPSWPAADTSDRNPDLVVRQPTRLDQPLLYRLNGDHNPLHSDPAVARAAGFERPIMHGACTVGFVGRALVHAVCDGDPARLYRFGCRFASPTMPGDEVETRIWRTTGGAVFTTMVGDRSVLGSGFVFLRD